MRRLPLKGIRSTALRSIAHARSDWLCKRCQQACFRSRDLGWRRYDTLDRKCRRNLAGGLSRRCERAGELRSDTSGTGPHRLLPWPKSVLSWTIGSCRCQSARAIGRRVVSGNYRNRPSETQTTSATIKAQTIPARVRGPENSITRPLLST